MSRPKQNLPRSFKAGVQRAPASPASSRRRWPLVALAVLLAGVLLVATQRRGADSRGISERRIDREVSGFLAGIPQTQTRLGAATAPVTLQIYLDLKDPDSRNWLLKDLPAIVRDFVRRGELQLLYRAYKTNTFDPAEFVRDQTAALAAGNQHKLWNYIYTFYAEQHSEFVRYATEAYLNHIAAQIPGLDLARWHTDRRGGRREEQTTAEDQAARALHLHVTPSFRIGRTGGPLHNYSGHTILKYGDQHPIALPDTTDVAKMIHDLH